MNTHPLTFHGERLLALGAGALFWPDRALLVVSDLHLGKSERIARRSGQQLPPYEVRDTLTRLDATIEATGARQVLCLGDSFDDRAAAQALDDDARLWIARLQAGRQWWWIEGNHDPGPLDFGSTHLSELTFGPITFRHIASPGASAEVSGHYHPKAGIATRGRGMTRPCFLVDAARIILPAFGTYTGGLRSDDRALCSLMGPDAIAVLTGPVPRPMPMPRRVAAAGR